MRPANETLKLCPLGSGSKGNAYWLEAGTTTVLVDAGLSLRALEQRIEAMERSMEQLDHIFITHEHGDHIRGLRVLLRKHRPVVWATRGTLRCLRGVFPDGASVRLIDGDAEIAGELRVRTIPVSHDAADPVAFRFDSVHGSAAVVTDLGEWDMAVARWLEKLDILVCEANHDPQMLQDGPYPFYLKRRIASTRGHLDNHDGAALALEAVRTGAGKVILAHMSEKNNSPSLAMDVFLAKLESCGAGSTLEIAGQHEPGPWVEAGRDDR